MLHFSLAAILKSTKKGAHNFNEVTFACFTEATC